MDLIKEVSFNREDNKELARLVDEYYKLTKNDKNDFYHVIYIDYDTGPCFLIKWRFFQPFKIPRVDFKQSLESLESTSFDELCFLLSTYATERKTILNELISIEDLPEDVKKIVAPTKGYLIFKDQGFEYYKLLTGADNAAAWRWVDDIQAYKKSTQNTFPNLTIKDKPFADFFTPREYGPRFKNRPSRAAYELFKYLNPDKQVLDGLVHIRHFEVDNNEKEPLHELLPVRFMIDAEDNFRLGVHLTNVTLDLDEYVEFGLHSDYCSNPKLLPMGCHIQHISKEEFIVDGDIIERDVDGADFVSFPFHAKIKGELPKGIEKKISVFKLF